MIRRVWTIEMEIPSGKLPGFYAQMIHKIGDEVEIIDRFGQMFIVADSKQLVQVKEILSHQK